MTPLPPELEARIVALEATPPAAAIDAYSWRWMLLLGIVLPVLLLALGWWLMPGGRR